jgi:hypothetical protein
MDVGFCIVGDRPQATCKAAPRANPIDQEKTNTVTTEYVDPDIELRRIHTVRLEREPDERGRLMAAAFTENGRPVVLVLNTN